MINYKTETTTINPEGDDSPFEIVKITFPEVIEEGYRKIKFLDTFSFECLNIEEEEADGVKSRSAYVIFDFGMSSIIQLDSRKNCIFMGRDDLSDNDKMFEDVKFDLFHAFFHYVDDPNYTHYHWALYGNLKDRVEIDEEFLAD